MITSPAAFLNDKFKDKSLAAFLKLNDKFKDSSPAAFSELNDKL